MPTPPYAVQPSEFAFHALVQRAARLPLGGQREVALAALMAARLARSGFGPAPERLTRELRETRSAASRTWFAALTLPAGVRQAALRVVEAAARDDASALAGAIDALITVAGPVLDKGAAAELRDVAQLARVEGWRA
ncbi:MAG: hypothetical protein ACT4R6_01015 [Gemmatimonadaceae bacterium]